MAKDFFCLDIGEITTKLADVHLSGTKLVADALGIIETDPLFYRSESETVIEKQAAILLKLISQLGIKKKSVHVIIPDSFSYSRFIEMPKLNEKELLSAIRYQADQFIPMPIEETNIDIEIVHEEEKSGNLHTLIAAAPKKLIEKVEKLIEYCGLVPETIEIEISAVGRFASYAFPKIPATGSQKSGILLINMAQNTTSVYCFDQSWGIINFNHNFNIGISLFVREIQVNLNVDQHKAEEMLQSFGLSKNASYNLNAILAAAMKDFLAEIQRPIALLSDKYNIQIKGAYLFHDSVKFSQLDQLIGKSFGIPSTTIDPYPLFTKNNMVDFFKAQLAQFVPVVGGNLK